MPSSTTIVGGFRPDASKAPPGRSDRRVDPRDMALTPLDLLENLIGMAGQEPLQH